MLASTHKGYFQASVDYKRCIGCVTDSMERPFSADDHAFDRS